MIFVFVLFLVTIIGIFLFMATLLAKEAEETERQYKIMLRNIKQCPPAPGAHHDWSYHPQTSRLTCTKCNFEAGSHVE